MDDTTPFQAARRQAEQRVDDIVEAARSGAAQAADQLADTKKPVKTLTKASVRLSKISHQTTDRIIRQQAKILTGSIDAAMGRLQAAAGASDVNDLVLGQTRLIPEHASRLFGDLRDMADIVFGAGAEMREIALGTFTELRGDGQTATAKPPRAATRKRARKTSTKAAAGKAAAAA